MMSEEVYYSRNIEALTDRIIELVRDNNKMFGPVKVREVRRLVKNILATHEVELQALWAQTGDHDSLVQ